MRGSGSSTIHILRAGDVTTLQKVKLTLRAMMEFGIVIGAALWGYHVGQSTTTKIILMIAVPALVFGFWALVDFHQIPRIGLHMRFIQEVLISFLTAVALYRTGAHLAGFLLGGVSFAHHSLALLARARTR
jgi:Protein of unknown function (DUF2568)